MKQVNKKEAEIFDPFWPVHKNKFTDYISYKWHIIKGTVT